MKKLLQFSTLVVATTLAAYPAAATIAPGTPIGRCLLGGDFSPCPALSGQLSAPGSFASHVGAGIAYSWTDEPRIAVVLPYAGRGSGDDLGDPYLGRFLRSAGAIAGSQFGVGETTVFISTFGTIGTINRENRRHYPEHEEGWNDPPALQPLSIINPEPAAILLTATGLLAIGALELRRRSKKT